MNRRQSLLGWGAVIAGFIAIAAAWGQVQGTDVVAVQLSYMTSGGLFGLGLITVGTGLIKSDDLRAIRTGVDELRDRVDDLEHDLADTQDWLRTLAVTATPPLDVPEISVEHGAGSARRR